MGTFNDNLIIFQSFAYKSMTETIDQQVNLFNGASRNGIVLTSARNVGDISQNASYAAIPGLIRNRNVYANGALTPKSLGMRQENTVKVASGTSPIQWTPSHYSYIQRNQEEQGVVVGEQLAKGIIQDQLNTSIKGAVAAVSANTAMVVSNPTLTATYGILNSALVPFGDHAQDVKCWDIHSKVMRDLFSSSLTGNNFLFSYNAVNVQQDPFGKVFVVTDSPSLVNLDGTYNTIGLTENAIIVEDNDDFNMMVVGDVLHENMTSIMKSEWTYNLGIKGYSWTAATGTASPTLTAIGTGANWTKTASFNKMTAAVVMVTK
jgi:hypothetical protein